MQGTDVYLWGTKVGTVIQHEPNTAAIFSYDRKFVNSGIQIAPIMMPLSRQNYSFPTLNEESFHKLPGLLADSLPDKYGTKVYESYLARIGRTEQKPSSIERLCYTGSRGMGALEYVPATGPEIPDSTLDIDEMAKLADTILSERSNIMISADEQTIAQLLKIGTSAGGARAKALIAWNEETKSIRSGQINAGTGYTYWLLKFGSLKNNKDKDKEADYSDYSKIEYAYSLMAKDVGIDMTECRLIQSNEGYHFMTKRFDRKDTGEKLHMQTLGALAHYDYNEAGAHSYEQAAAIMRKIGLKQKDIEQLYLRMLFNEMARNYDDHVKNISFLMNRKGEWTLSPVYDVTFSYNANSIWTNSHQMRINSKRENISKEDLIAVGRTMDISLRKTEQMLDKVAAVVVQWDKYAEYVGLTEERMEYIKSFHQKQILAPDMENGNVPLYHLEESKKVNPEGYTKL